MGLGLQFSRRGGYHHPGSWPLCRVRLAWLTVAIKLDWGQECQVKDRGLEVVNPSSSS